MRPPPITALPRIILAYVILTAGLPLIQKAAILTGGWTENVPLIFLYAVVPPALVWLASHRQKRIGAILLLAFMSSGVVINSMLLLSLTFPTFASPFMVLVLWVWTIGLIVSQLITGWLAFRVLQEHHRQPAPTDPSPLP